MLAGKRVSAPGEAVPRSLLRPSHCGGGTRGTGPLLTPRSRTCLFLEDRELGRAPIAAAIHGATAPARPQARRCTPAMPSSMVSPAPVAASGPRIGGERGCHKRGGTDSTLLSPQHRAGGARPDGSCSPLPRPPPSDARRFSANKLHCPGFRTVPVLGRLGYHRRAMHCGTCSLVPLPGSAGGAMSRRELAVLGC